MHSKLSCYQLKVNCFNMFYVSLMVTTKQKPVVDTQGIKRKESKHTFKENHQIRKHERKRGRKELQNSQKTMNKMAIVSSYQ